MFKSLSQNPEISAFLQFFPMQYWKTALQAMCLFGIRKVQSQGLPITMKTTEEILNPSNPLKKALNSMKNDIKSLTVAIKRIERRTQSSSDLAKEFSVSSEKRKREKNENAPRNSISNTLTKTYEKKDTKSCYLKKDVKEPKCCTLGDARKIFQTVQSERKFDGKDGIEFFKSRASHSTQDTSPKGFNLTLSSVNMTFGK
jgi:uncharacterized protein YoxC